MNTVRGGGKARCPELGWDEGWPGRTDRLPLCPRPCPDATLRCSRTNGKVFPVLSSSWAPTTSPRVNLQLPPPRPSPLFWPLPLLPRPPLGALASAPTGSVAFFSPTAPANSLPSCSAGRSWPSAHSGGGGARIPAGGEGAHPDRAGREPPLPRCRGPLEAQARATPATSGRQD